MQKFWNHYLAKVRNQIIIVSERVWGKMLENAANNEKDYVMSSIDEYFEILDREAQKRSKMVAKSLTKYLKNVQANTKYDELKTSALH